jgi:hypothetical protein
MLSDYVRTIEYGGIDHADENLIPIGAAIAFIESQASLLETYSTAEPSSPARSSRHLELRGYKISKA